MTAAPVILSSKRYLMTPDYHRAYDFSIDGEVVGSVEIVHRADGLTQRATFTAGDEQVDTTYRIRLAAGEITAFRTDESDGWYSMDSYPADAYPLAAFPLLLERATPTYRYQPIDDSTGELLQHRTLERGGSVIVERQDETIHRSFTLDGDCITEIAPPSSQLSDP